MDKILELYTYTGEGVQATPFPDANGDPIEIGAFRYDAKRMGGAPTITASVDYPSCLDGVWTDKVYAEFNGEKYYLKQIPTSSYDNTNVMYRHEVTLVSERAVLDNVYFFDVVTGNPSESDKPVSNSTKVTFFGGIRDFASRLNASLEYSGLDYEVVVDDEVTKEEKLMSFEDQFFSNVLQEIYNTYETPYYFDGKTIHIGYAKSDVIVPDLSYGVDNALLSITKNNANYKTVNRATGYGSTDNIPFYYPNNSPKGEIKAECNNSELEVVIKDYDKYANEVNIGEIIERTDLDYSISSITPKTNNSSSFSENENILVDTVSSEHQFKVDIEIEGQASQKGEANFEINISDFVMYYEWGEAIDVPIDVMFFGEAQKWSTYNNHYYWSGYGYDCYIDQKKWRFNKTQNSCTIHVRYTVDGSSEQKLKLSLRTGSHSDERGRRMSFVMKIKSLDNDGWKLGEKKISLEDVGLASNGLAQVGDTITQRLVKFVNTSQNLMPSVYRHSAGKERFYNAVNYPYSKPEGFEINKVFLGADGYWRNEIGEYEIEGIIHNDAYKDDEGIYIHFDHPYVEGKAKEHIVVVEDLKPTIKKAVNSRGLRMDMFSEFAYDDDDNEETEENEDGSDRDFVHSYFFGKLRKLDFNLFDCAIEQQPMTISFTSGDCGACNFEIGVTEEFPQKNPVRVNPDGTLMRDENGRVVCGQFEPIYENEIQDRQQDTINNEVWIALRKEEDTYGELMPKAPIDGVGGHRPKAARNEDGTPNNEGDTFVILGINLPEEYVTRQERQLEKEIIKYIKDNNEEKFTFSVGFSRIYFAENETILKNLSENSKVRIFYNNIPYDLYVSSFSYTLDEGDVLPDIKVELDETLKIGQNPIQRAVNQVKSELGNALRNIDVVGAGTPYFLRKDVDDEVIGRVNFRKGVKFGEGGKVEVLDNNSAKLTIEYLEVTKKASFTSLEIQEKTHVGGQILVTPAAINCGEVEEFEGFYRCYFQTKGVEGDEIFNQFAMDDQAISQTYNTWGSRYYWRKVVGIGEDYIDLSKIDGEYDEDSDAPMAGDKIIQLGNQSDATRQNAIVIAAYGDGSPYIIQYKGINSFEIGDDKIVTKLSSTENIFTGKVHMERGSEGLDQLPEWIEVKDKAEEALEKAGSISEEAFAELEQYIDDVRQELQDQIDGAVDSYFEDYEPSTSNYPAKDWTSEEKESHLNDTFTNLADGRSWRWSKAAGVYVWVEIADTATSEALKIAGQAKESADRKIRMFVEQPYTPYSIGDLWSRGEEAPLMRCIKDKESGSFSEEDWDLADNSQSYTDEVVSNIKLGGTNLLRNSGFTGDYLSERLSDEKVLEGSAELYSSPLDHWNASSSVIVLDSTETISGKVANINGGTLSQKLYYKTVAGSDYVLSFRAKASGSSSITITLGDISKSIALSSNWNDYEVAIAVGIDANNFSISNTKCSIGNLKLEKGNKASAWSASPLDNASDRAYYQSMKYIQNAFEGATDVFGGLVLTEQIQVGDYDSDKKEWVKMNGGMSGVYESDHDVAFWAGGTDKQAIETVMMYADDPTFQPTEEQLASMANFVVTHGGRAILNDAIVKGTVYAKDGVFEGEIKANKGNFGDLHIVSSENWGDAGVEGEITYDSGIERHTLILRPDYFEMVGYRSYDYGSEDRVVESIRISPYIYGERYDGTGVIEIYSDWFEKPAINITKGHIDGLRGRVLSTTNDVVYLYDALPHVVILSTQTNNIKSVYLPKQAEKGDTIHIINSHRSALIVGMEDNTKKIVFNTEDGTTDSACGWNNGSNNPYKVEAYFDGNMWYLCPIK